MSEHVSRINIMYNIQLTGLFSGHRNVCIKKTKQYKHTEVEKNFSVKPKISINSNCCHYKTVFGSFQKV